MMHPKFCRAREGTPHLHSGLGAGKGGDDGNLEGEGEAAQVAAVAHVLLVAGAGDEHHVDVVVLHEVARVGAALLDLQHHLRVNSALLQRSRRPPRRHNAKAQLLLHSAFAISAPIQHTSVARQQCPYYP